MPIKVYNVDATKNKAGLITHYTNAVLGINGEKSQFRFLATALGRQRVILGYPWLRKANPDVNWRKGTLRWRTENTDHIRSTILNSLLTMDLTDIHEDPTEDELVISYLQGGLTKKAQDVWSKTTMNHSTAFAQKAEAQKEQKTPEEIVPSYFHEYLDNVFSEEKATRFPERRPWDHKINLKDSFTPHVSKVYPMTQGEDEAVKSFIQENLANGYIRPSESPQAAGFFFVAKKDAKKLRPVQDYRKLNEATIRDVYPLPRIPDLIDKL